MKTPTKVLASAIFTSGLLAATAAHGQLTLGDTYEIRSDTANGSLSQRYKRDGVDQPYYLSGVYSYVAANSSGSIPLRADGSNARSDSEVGLGRKMNSPIFYFQLPELGAGLSVANANLEFTVRALGSTGIGTGNVDLWGLGFISEAPSAFLPVTPTIGSRITQAELDVVLANPDQILVNSRGPELWLTGDTDGRAGLGIPSITKIQDNIIDNLAPPVAGDRISTNAEGSASLDIFLSSLYAAGAEPGNWAAFRLTYDTEYDPSTGFYGYDVYGSIAAEADTDPTLGFTAIPEPSTVAFFSGLAALAVVGLVRRRRSRS